MQRGKGRYPVADYRLAAEINLALGQQQAQQGQQGQQSQQEQWDAPDAWYAPLLAHRHAAAAAAAGAAAGGAGGQPGGGERRGVYSFCMCPGGQIVPTSTSEEELCINGMSFSRWGRGGMGSVVGRWVGGRAAGGRVGGQLGGRRWVVGNEAAR